MIVLNLLPWRESKKLKKRKIFICQVLWLLLLSLLIICLIMAYLAHDLHQKKKIMVEVMDENQFAIAQKELFQIKTLKLTELKTKTMHINQLIEQRQKMASILSILSSFNQSLRLTNLSVNSQLVKITGGDSTLDSVLGFFNTLRAAQLFCNVTFSPIAKQVNSRQENVSPSFFENRSALIDFELDATLCQHAIKD